MLTQRERLPVPSHIPVPPIADPAAGLFDALAAREAGFDSSDPAWRAEAPRRAEQQLGRAVGPCGRRLAADAVRHARSRLPSPARYPSLQDALARRAAVFGPYDGDEVSVAPRRAWVSLGEAAARALRAIADRLDRQVAACPPDFVAVSAMVALGSVLGRKVAVRPQTQTDWFEVPSCFGARSAQRRPRSRRPYRDGLPRCPRRGRRH